MNQSKQSQKTELDEDEDAVKLGKTCDQVQITQQVERHGMLQALALEPNNEKKNACNLSVKQSQLSVLKYVSQVMC